MTKRQRYVTPLTSSITRLLWQFKEIVSYRDLNNEEVKSYLENHGIEFTPLSLFDEVLLEDRLFYYLNSVIRFKFKDKYVAGLISLVVVELYPPIQGML